VILAPDEIEGGEIEREAFARASRSLRPVNSENFNSAATLDTYI
jgi:hypothetical protein